MEIRYEVGLSAPHTHLFDVRLTVVGIGSSQLVFQFPSWTPGSYLIREYVQHVQDVSAADVNGHPVVVTQIDKRSFGAAPKDGFLALSYRVYAHELSVRTNHFDDTHALIVGAATFFTVQGYEDHPLTVEIKPPAGWGVETTLPPVADTPNTWRADNFDHLVDSPIDCAQHENENFVVLGVPHRFVVWGRGNYDLKKLRIDCAKIVEHAAAIFGKTLPYDRYLFVLQAISGARGGLEHKNCCVLGWHPNKFAPQKQYEQFLRLVAHEHFHVWNIKRIRPKSLGPFDYGVENYTRMLWLHEGGTVYYEGLVPVRAGVITGATWLADLADSIQKLDATPGRKHMSMADSSFNAWTKLYRPTEHSRNNTVSYYLKGELVCFCLDWEIRRNTENQRSLDDVMRALYAATYPDLPGYEEDEFAKIVTQATGVHVEDFLRRFVDSTEELPLEQALSWYGLSLSRTWTEEAAVERGAWLGIQLESASSTNRLKVTSVDEGSPAMMGGIYAGDELLAVDGFRVDRAALTDRAKITDPGTVSTFTVFRRDMLREITVTWGSPPLDKVMVKPRANANEIEKSRCRSLVGQDLFNSVSPL
ncbi:MAG: M61 family metallopeptidase [Myxococcales bacterium]|nr:M61 family metallopeptidase [Myxococcales bacterium]